MAVGSGPAIGAELGGYRLEALIGRGGMGAVYRAKDLRLGRRVALKLLASALAGDEQFRERFLRESRMAASIDHANIVPIFEAGEADGALFIAMRLVEGTDLGALLRREGPIEPARAVGLVRYLAAALDAAHARMLVHRDVKPSNALVAREGEDEHVYLADFGLTKHITSYGGPTASGQMVGTIDYVAPEQIRGERVDSRADQYALGCVLFACLTGEPPFKRPSVVGTIYAHLEQEPPRASEERSGLPPSLDGVFARALAKEPNKRFETCGQLADAAEAALRNIRVRSRARQALGGREPRLPRPATALLGRDREVADVAGLLVSKGVRLVTLTGPGGVGKTRLALQVARELLAKFDETVLVELAAVRDDSLVLPAIAAALGMRDSGRIGVGESVARELGDREVLLVLDNLEQVVSAAAALGVLLATTGGLRLLVTSRVALRLSAERVISVAPLPADDAVQLFVERALATGYDANADEKDADAVGAICARLDRMPLAIELAAARTPVLPPRALLRRLDRRFELLTAGGRDSDDRHGTLRATLDWSHALLDERERVLLRRLAVFASGFTAEAADRVCGGEAVLDGLSGLVEHSLLRRDVGPDGEPRFMMLETIREYAAHKLRVNGEASTVGGSHAAYMVALAERVEPDLLAGDAAAFELLEVEHDNLRAALDWAHATGRHDLELRLAGAIWWFWYLRVHRTEGLARLDEALAGAGATVGAARAKALRGRGLLRARGGRFEEAEADARELLALAADVADPGLHAQALHLLAGVEHQRGDYAGARRLYEESAALSRQTGDVQLLARLLANGLADIALNERRFEDAAAVAREALVIARASGGAEPVIIPLQNLASALLVLARAGEATEYFVESLGHATEIHDHESIAWALAGLGAAAAELGHAERAARLLGAVDAALAARELELQRFEADRHEQVIARLRRDLGEEAFTAAWAEGHAMTRDEASAFALSGVTDQERPR